MTRLRFILLFLLLALASDRIEAALSGAEKRAYDAAVESFDLGFYDRAEQEFAQFVEKHPKSERLNEAILRQAQALFQQRKFVDAERLLTAREADAGFLADEFLYWTGAALFQTTNYSAAANAYGRLVRTYLESARRLEAAVGEAAAFAKLGEWLAAVELLRKPDGAFRQAALGLTNNVTVARGFIVLAEAQLALQKYPDAEAALNRIGAPLTGELEWQRIHLLAQAVRGTGRLEDALRLSAEGIAVGAAARRGDLLSESAIFQADVLEQSGRGEEAIATLRQHNLGANIPVERQRQALARIAALALAQNRFGVAVETLESFLAQFANAPAADLAWLTLGEVQLRLHVTPGTTNQNGGAAVPGTNHLALALGCFDRLIAGFTNSAYLGKGHLGRGWCLWLDGKYAESAAAFAAAESALPSSPDQAVARFKLGDAQLAQNDYAGALESYRASLQLATNWPAANAELRTPGLYQALRASLAMTNFVAAEEAMREILQLAPDDPTAARSLLLVTQGYVDANQPAEAQRLFQEFVKRLPDSEWRPQVELLMARVEEQQAAWTNAIARYEEWLNRFPSHPLVPRAEFQRALAVARSGQETSALGLFTNYVVQFRTNNLAARAQWWVADYYFGRGEFLAAEINFKQLFQNWKSSELAYEARMMAGRAAMDLPNYVNAIEYFTGLTSDTNCPPDLWARAVLAFGGARMRLATTETNRLDAFAAAARIFGQIHQRPTAGEFAALAWGEMAKCYLQMATQDTRHYESASNAFQRVLALPAAGVAARSEAQCGLGDVLDKMAQLSGEPERKALLIQARNHYLDVALEKNLRPGETAVGFWVKECGFRALRLLEAERAQGWATQDADTIVRFCRKLQALLPRPAIQARLETIAQRAQVPVAN